MFTILRNIQTFTGIGGNANDWLPFDVVVILIFGQNHFISLRENAPFIFVCDWALGFILLFVCYIFKLELKEIQ